MGWESDDGRHEGVIEHVFADGTSGSAWSSGPLATTAADRTPLEGDAWRLHTDAEVVGWRAACSDLTSYSGRRCWTGPLWTRADTPNEQDIAQHRIHATSSVLPDDLEKLVIVDWYAHIAPAEAAYPVEQAADALTEVVRQVLASGASWESIAEATGFDVDAVQRRWGYLAPDEPAAEPPNAKAWRAYVDSEPYTPPQP